MNKEAEKNLKAPELRINDWLDNQGERMESPIRISDFKHKFKVIYCFQSWCPGCHSVGLPSLKKMVGALKENDQVIFLAIQTVFEGREQNTFEKMQEIQKQYALPIPFGHDDGSQAGEPQSTLMTDYHTGGTPWFILINQQNEIVFADFHLNTEGAIEYIQSQTIN